MKHLYRDDPVLAGMITQEAVRLEETLNLIAAESHAPCSVMEVLGSVLNTKTIEGYPGGRFHAGCVHVDAVERLAIERGRELFGAEYLNVQPHSGTSANLAVYFAVLQRGDPILSMGLPQGGHLSHGHRASITGKCFSFSHYGVDPDTEKIDYDRVHEQALKVRPRMIVAGASSYPRLIDYAKMAAIAADVSAMLLVDMAHIAGLVAAGLHPSPVPYADVVTTTTHKTLRGPRAGMILCKGEVADDVDRAVFPGLQGGPLMHIIAAKAVALGEALKPCFRDYQQGIVDNAHALAQALAAGGLRLVSGGTDNHLMLVDVTPLGVTGQGAEGALEEIGIACNKNQIPYDRRSPRVTSGIRLGTPAVTTRGMGAEQMARIGALIVECLAHVGDPTAVAQLRRDTLALCRLFPVWR